jgi:hypothetical protein
MLANGNLSVGVLVYVAVGLNMVSLGDWRAMLFAVQYSPEYKPRPITRAGLVGGQ